MSVVAELDGQQLGPHHRQLLLQKRDALLELVVFISLYKAWRSVRGLRASDETSN